jgi:hypothetical protein
MHLALAFQVLPTREFFSLEEGNWGSWLPVGLVCLVIFDQMLDIM